MGYARNIMMAYLFEILSHSFWVPHEHSIELMK